MSITKEFREFVLRGNVLDLAIGVIIGAAFGKIVDSLVNDIILPLISMIIGKVDFSNLFITLGTVPSGVASTYADLKKAGVPVFAYGNFLTIVVNFVILAFIIFMMVRYVNKLKNIAIKQAEAVPVEPEEHIKLLREIRDNLKK